MPDKKINSKWAIQFFVVLSIIVGLILTEIFIRIWFGPEVIKSNSRMKYSPERDLAISNSTSEKRFDSRTKFEVYRDLKDKGVSSILNIHPRDLRKNNVRILIEGRSVFPLSGIAKEHTILCNEWGEYIYFDSDKYGFRNPKNIWDTGPIHVALIGDSFAHGNCVPEKQTIAGVIRKDFPRTLNLGRSGNGSLLEYASLKEFLPSQSPQFVFWIYFEGNDLAEMATERNDLFLKRYLDLNYSFGIKNHQSEVNTQLKSFINKELKKYISLNMPCEQLKKIPKTSSTNNCADRSLESKIEIPSLLGWGHLIRKGWNRVQPHYARLLPTSHKNYHPFHKRDYKPLFELFIEILEQAKYTVASWGGEFIFVYLPDVRENRPLGMFEKEIKERITGMNIRYLDGSLIFENIPLSSLRKFNDDGVPMGHYTPEGYSLIAQAMLGEIEDLATSLPKSNSVPRKSN